MRRLVLVSAIVSLQAACAAGEDAPAAFVDAGARLDARGTLDSAAVDDDATESEASTDASADTHTTDASVVDTSVAKDAAPLDMGTPCSADTPCTTTCGSAGTRRCTAGFLEGACTPPPEICNLVDDDCDGAVDELDCSHQVTCTVFADGYADASTASDAVLVSSGKEACIPGATAATCRKWFGRCRTTAAADGHTHDVTFSVFGDGYTGLSAGSDAIYVNGSNRMCTPGAACDRWFGRGKTNEVQAHTHDIVCKVFDDGYANQSDDADAVLFDGSKLCIPGATSATCRRWFGRCHTK